MADPQALTETQYAYYTKTLNAARNAYPDAKFIVNLGDLTDSGFYDDWWSYFFNASKGTCEDIPLMTCMGNHEMGLYTILPQAAESFNRRFNNPTNGHGLLPEDYDYSYLTNRYSRPVLDTLDNTVYSFDYGNAHFAVLNTGAEYGAAPAMELQKEWLENDLKSTDKKWKIVMLHRAIYGGNDKTFSKGGYDDTMVAFRDIIEENGADLVMSGHDHTYMRTYQMKGTALRASDDTSGESLNENIVDTNADSVTKGAGTVYTVAGTAADRRTVPETTLSYIAKSHGTDAGDNPYYGVVEITDTELVYVTKLADGTEIDRVTIK